MNTYWMERVRRTLKACYGDFVFGCDTDSFEYVQFSKEHGTKTKTAVE